MFDGGRLGTQSGYNLHPQPEPRITILPPAVLQFEDPEEKLDLHSSHSQDSKYWRHELQLEDPEVKSDLPPSERKDDKYLRSSSEDESPESRDFKSLLASSAVAPPPPPSPADSVYQVPQVRQDGPRMCENSMLAQFSKTRFAIRAEGFPVWALCLERAFCSDLYVVDFESSTSMLESFRLRNLNPTLWIRLTEYLGKDRIHYASEVPADTLYLCSGSLRYLFKHLDQHPDCQAILISDSHGRCRNLPSRPDVDWHRLFHASFGGPTLFETVVGFSRCSASSPKVTGVRRSVGDFINYGMDSFKFKSVKGELTVRGMLHPKSLGTYVRYPSGRAMGGYISRAMDAVELGHMFGLPTWLSQSSLDLDCFDSLIPIQMLDGCLRPVLRASNKPIEKQFTVPARVVAPRPVETWLKSIGKTLPGSWIDDSLVTDKAAKEDKSLVPTALWDQRILLIWPHLSLLWLVWFRCRMLNVMMRAMYVEFTEFMGETHGEGWSTRLAYAKVAKAAKRVHRQSGGTAAESGVGGEGLEEAGRCEEDAELELLADAEAGRNVLRSFGASDWWSWKQGSTLIFWRWPKGEQRKAARDGMKAFITGPLPANVKPSRPPKPAEKALMFEKLCGQVRRGYIQLGRTVKNLVDYFGVPKGDDIRMVFNGARGGLNDVLWAPNFWLPSAKSATRVLDFEYYNVDLDMGEMFPNFPLPRVLRAYSGVDLTCFKDEFVTLAPDLMAHVNVSRLWGRWERNWMGTTPSPFMSIRFFYWAEEFVRGNRHDPSNTLGWDRVKLNLPGMEDYDPSFPRVMKWREALQRIANDIITFVDDVRASAYTAEESWLVARQLAARIQYLGIQDAPRKRRPPSKDPGAWAGSIFSTSGGKITQTVSQEKWEKAKGYLEEISAVMECNSSDLSYKYLEQVRGFLVHLSMTFENVKPYLKGLHLTLSSHLPQRDLRGWKRGDKDWLRYVAHEVETGRMTPEGAHEALHPPEFADIPIPESVAPLPMMKSDFSVLLKLFESSSPPKVTVRCSKIFYVLYGFADASGSGFGSSILNKDGISLRIGTWGKDDEENSSNWREFENVVEGLEHEEKEGNLENAVIFMGTDNSTVEGCVHKGLSSSPKLHDLVIRVKQIEMRTGCEAIIFHVSGERMQGQGTDGFSRGNLKEGIATGLAMLSFIPLHLSAVDRSPSLVGWINSWFQDKEVELLEPEDWFERGHDLDGGEFDKLGFWRPAVRKGCFLWAPPPAAASAAIEELRKARVKRQKSFHVFIVPRLLGTEWRRQLHKAADFVLEIPAGHIHWGKCMYEPLMIGIVLPFIRSSPWQLRGTPKVLALGRTMRRVLKEEELDGGSVLFKFLLEFERFRSLPEDVVRKMLYFKS